MRETEYGSFNQALAYRPTSRDGGLTKFQTLFGALNVNVQANKDLRLKFTASSFNTVESERFDVLSEYYLDELERDPSSSRYGEVSRIWASADHWSMRATTSMPQSMTLAHKGYLQRGRSYIQWGADARSEMINDS